MRIDLHIHTSFSADGKEDPYEILNHAIDRDVQFISITDHGCVEAIPIISHLAETQKITIVPGIEITAFENAEQHILGYGFNTNHPSIEKIVRTTSEYKQINIGLILDMLSDMGIMLRTDEYVINGRKDIANTMLKRGIVSDITEAFDLYLDGEEYMSLPIKYISTEEAIGAIVEAGGKAVLAHPFSVSENYDELMGIIKQLINYGLCGIEAYYGQYTLSDQRGLADLADKLGLFKTSGSDFHGSGHGCRKRFGDFFQSNDALEAAFEFIWSL